MKLLIICPGKVAKDKSQIKCYSDLLNYYLPKALISNIDCDIKNISVTPNANNIIKQLKEMSFDGYDAMVFLGIRFFSHQGYQPKKILDFALHAVGFFGFGKCDPWSPKKLRFVHRNQS